MRHRHRLIQLVSVLLDLKSFAVAFWISSSRCSRFSQVICTVHSSQSKTLVKRVTLDAIETEPVKSRSTVGISVGQRF